MEIDWRKNIIENFSDYLDNPNDIFCIDYLQLLSLSPRFGNYDNPENISNLSKNEISDFLTNLKINYSKIIIFSGEEFAYNVGSIKFFVDTAIEYGFKTFVYSFNSNVNDFFKIKYPNDYKKSIIANTPKTLLNDVVYEIVWDRLMSNEIKKDINLLFLNYNRKINRDYIITYLNEKNELFNMNNFISYHNNYTMPSENYPIVYKKYIEKHNLNLDWLNTLKLQPEEVNVHQQVNAQEKGQTLHARSKFNIICEPYFGGLSDDINDYEYYNHTISRKTIYPFYYKNVVFVHENNSILSDTLKKLGFELFFDNLDDFINNMTDDFYYLEETQRKLENNRILVKKLNGRGNGQKDSTYMKKLSYELNKFFN